MRSRRAFTLIETLIAVAIISLLATIAIPAYQGYAMRVKQAERDFVMSEIERALVTEARQSGDPPDPLPANPPFASLGQHKREFVSDVRWRAITGLPEAPVYHSYQVDRNISRGSEGADTVGATSLGYTCFCLNAYGDLDADTRWSLLRRCYCNGTVAGREVYWEHIPTLDRSTTGIY